ncbi:MAG: LacI family DNA-binding transcriptional regulator [Spirochaetales bacterium]|nr:LacI family DNA-binding transcriptional regulator [Spirochaetales bacterium]
MSTRKAKTNITRKDVAEKAGVSGAVVSRVLNNSGYVAEEKRKRVLKVIKELGYNPNPVAVSLKKNRTRQILYYVRDLGNYYYMEMYRAMNQYAFSKNYIFILAGFIDGNKVSGLMVDGVLLPSEDMAVPEILESLRVPVALVGYERDTPADISRIDISVGETMTLALDYLRDLGHEKIAFACLSIEDKNEPRYKEYLKWMSSRLGNEVDRYILGSPGEHDSMGNLNYFEIGKACARNFLERKLDATAVVCFNDDMAIGLMSFIQQEGVKIPDQLSVVGIDGHQGGAYSSPPLTTVSMEMEQHGRECARMIIDKIDGVETAEQVVIHPKLIIRNSVARMS